MTASHNPNAETSLQIDVGGRLVIPSVGIQVTLLESELNYNEEKNENIFL